MNNPFNHKQVKLSLFGITASGFLDALRMALASIRTNKMRSILTLLGIIIGVMTVVGMLSVIEGLNQSMARQIGALGSNVIYISKFPAVHFGPGDPEMRNRPDIEIEYASLIEEMCPAVLSASPEKYRYARIKSGSKDSASVQIVGGGENYFVVNNFELSGGRGLIPQDVIGANDVCILAYEVADLLFPIEDPLGKEITIQGRRFTVVGVLEQKGQMLGQSMDNFVLIPYTVFNKLFGDRRSDNFIAVQARSKQDLPAAIDQVEELLRRKRNVAPGAPNNFEIITQDSLMSIYNQITGAAFAVMVGVAGISLLVGGIGIMNIMLVSVTERTREIGIRKAVGARRKAILLQFLTEAVSLSVGGGTMGIIVGVALAIIVAYAVDLPRAIPLWSVGLGFFFSAAVGIFFGWYPAYKASKLDPIQALHYE